MEIEDVDEEVDEEIGKGNHSPGKSPRLPIVSESAIDPRGVRWPAPVKREDSSWRKSSEYFGGDTVNQAGVKETGHMMSRSTIEYS